MVTLDCDFIMLKMSADDNLKHFSYQKIGFDNSCKMSFKSFFWEKITKLLRYMSSAEIFNQHA